MLYVMLKLIWLDSVVADDPDLHDRATSHDLTDCDLPWMSKHLHSFLFPYVHLWWSGVRRCRSYLMFMYFFLIANLRHKSRRIYPPFFKLHVLAHKHFLLLFSILRIKATLDGVIHETLNRQSVWKTLFHFNCNPYLLEKLIHGFCEPSP